MAARNSWVLIPKGSHFSLANLPFGILSTLSNTSPRPAVAIGDHCLDLQAFSTGGGFEGIDIDLSVFDAPSLNAFAALGRDIHRKVRNYLQDVLSQDTTYPAVLRDNEPLRAASLVSRDQVQMHMPMQIGDYTDFYGCKNHAFNVGSLFRGPANALQPNYLHLPVAYHGRASSITVSGTPVIRPNGQILENPTDDPKAPVCRPSRRLDIELELGAFLCANNPMGTPIPIHEAAKNIFGVVLLNDWSARDIQAWEYIPLGPFNAKNFCSTISPWVVLADALEPFRCRAIESPTNLLPYLQEKDANNLFDIRLQVDIRPAGAPRSTTIVRSNSRHLTYSFAQMLAHHTIGGCPMRVGDLFGSGTLSGTEAGAEGSLLELSQGGKKPISLEGGMERIFLEDEDTVTISGLCGSEETGLVGFGECIGTIYPSPVL